MIRTIPNNHLDEALLQAGIRLTPQRLAICRLLAASKEHPTAQQIYQALKPEYPSLSLATVYNTLDVLVSLGEVSRLGSAGDGKEHYDADTGPHINLACIACHSVIDMPSEQAAALNAEISSESGYQIIGARVLFYGLCPNCQAAIAA